MNFIDEINFIYGMFIGILTFSLIISIIEKIIFLYILSVVSLVSIVYCLINFNTPFKKTKEVKKK